MKISDSRRYVKIINIDLSLKESNKKFNVKMKLD